MSFESSGASANPGPKTEWWTPRLAGPLIAAAVVRLALLAAGLARSGASSLIQADTTSYLIPGRNLLLHGRFFADGVPDLVRLPGYSLFLALFSLAGLPAAAVANVILSVFSVVLVWRLGRAVFDDSRIALVAAWIFAFEPISVIYSVFLLSETLFLALFLLSMERLVEFLRGRRLLVLATAGLWLAAATFVRPVTYYLPIALALGLFLVLARVPGLRWKAPAVLLISVLPWLAAWQIRNKIETGYGGFTSNTDVYFYTMIKPEVESRAKTGHYVDARKDLGYTPYSYRGGQFYLYEPYLALHPEQAGWNQGQRIAFMHSAAFDAIRAHFGWYLRSFFQGFLKTAFNPGSGDYDLLLFPEAFRPVSFAGGDEGPISWGITLAKEYPGIAAEKAAFAVALLGLYLFAARGVFRSDMHSAYLWLLLGISLYIFSVSAMMGGLGAVARLRLPVMPIICILAAAGWPRVKTISP